MICCIFVTKLWYLPVRGIREMQSTRIIYKEMCWDRVSVCGVSTILSNILAVLNFASLMPWDWRGSGNVNLLYRASQLSRQVINDAHKALSIVPATQLELNTLSFPPLSLHLSQGANCSSHSHFYRLPVSSLGN